MFISLVVSKSVTDTSGWYRRSLSSQIREICHVYLVNFSAVSRPRVRDFPAAISPTRIFLSFSLSLSLSKLFFIAYTCRASKRIEVVNGYDRRFNTIQSRRSGPYLCGWAATKILTKYSVVCDHRYRSLLIVAPLYGMLNWKPRGRAHDTFKNQYLTDNRVSAG